MDTFFVIDVGNSETKWAWVNGNRMGKEYRVPTRRFVEGNPWRFPGARVPSRPQGAVVACVVPSALRGIRRSLALWGIRKPCLVSSKLDLGIRIRYPYPSTIGADRLVNAVAVAAYYRCPAVVIDFGTAVTFDVISAQKEYLGGVIAPGLSTMTHYLYEKTALLPRVVLKEPKSGIGKSTVQAMQIGAVIGYRGLIRAILSEVCREMQQNDSRMNIRRNPPCVIATGGNARLITAKLTEIDHVDPQLTLKGLRLLGWKNQFESTTRGKADRR